MAEILKVISEFSAAEIPASGEKWTYVQNLPKCTCYSPVAVEGSENRTAAYFARHKIL